MYSALSKVRQLFKDQELHQIHLNAVAATNELKCKEAELIKALQEVDRHLVHRFVGYNSLNRYAVDVLGLSEYQAFEYICVARKAYDFPKLQEAIEDKEITITKARRIASVINERNQMVWLEAAKTMPKRQLEKAIAEVNPKASVGESARFINGSHLEVRLCAREESYEKLERVRDLLCQKKQKTITLDETIDEICAFYLEKHDPVEKAKRVLQKKARMPQQESKIDPGQTGNKSIIKLDRIGDSRRSSPCQGMKAPVQRLNAVEAGHQLGLGQIQFRIPAEKSCLLKSEVVHEFKGDVKTGHHAGGQNTEQLVRGSEEVEANQQSGPGQIGFSLPVARCDKRQVERDPLKSFKESRKKGRKIPTSVLHQVNLHDLRRCQWRLPSGQICGQVRFTQVHHIQLLSKGGSHELHNLTTLCSGHHQICHEINNYENRDLPLPI